MNVDKIQELKNEVAKSPASNAVFHVFAVRQRARNRVTLSSLYQRMLAEGFKYGREDYANTLKVLASLGFGVLDLDPKGRVRGLKNINITLQSLGQAACGDNSLEKFEVKQKFIKMVPKPEALKPKETPVEAVNRVDINIELIVNGKVVHIPVPEEFTEADTAKLIYKLKH